MTGAEATSLIKGYWFLRGLGSPPRKSLIKRYWVEGPSDAMCKPIFMRARTGNSTSLNKRFWSILFWAPCGGHSLLGIYDICRFKYIYIYIIPICVHHDICLHGWLQLDQHQGSMPEKSTNNTKTGMGTVKMPHELVKIGGLAQGTWWIFKILLVKLVS